VAGTRVNMRLALHVGLMTDCKKLFKKILCMTVPCRKGLGLENSLFFVFFIHTGCFYFEILWLLLFSKYIGHCISEGNDVQLLFCTILILHGYYIFKTVYVLLHGGLMLALSMIRTAACTIHKSMARAGS
jgi:hypothetical protein